ncbi:hypothetical protein [uncultured Pseudokineococcus sp.]|nr:hypothetical protein [uncultured Pseudokineococcus sp.]
MSTCGSTRVPRRLTAGDVGDPQGEAEAIAEDERLAGAGFAFEGRDRR